MSVATKALSKGTWSWPPSFRVSRGSIGTDQEQALMAYYERAEQLVEDTGSQELGPQMLHGIASRLLNRWDKAEQAFRKATELRPGLTDAWLELTWSLASLADLTRRSLALDVR
jgi:hypothetical protein